jgi:hypothetical protein
VHLIKLQSGDGLAAIARIAAADLKKAGANGSKEEIEPAKDQPTLL